MLRIFEVSRHTRRPYAEVAGCWKRTGISSGLRIRAIEGGWRSRPRVRRLPRHGDKAGGERTMDSREKRTGSDADCTNKILFGRPVQV